MVCSKCGRQIANGAKFCTYCGAAQGGASGGRAPYDSRGGEAFGSRGRDPYGSRGGDAFGSRSGDAFGSRGGAFDSRGRGNRGGDAFGGAPRRGGSFGGGDSFGSRGGFERPARREGESNMIFLLIGMALALAGGIVRACMNIQPQWRNSLESAWSMAKSVGSMDADAGAFYKVSTIFMILYHALPGLLMILFAVLVITKGRRKASGTGAPALWIPICEFICLNVVLIWGMIVITSYGGGDVAGEIVKTEFLTFLLPILMEIVFAVVYIIETGKMARGKNVFIWLVPIMGAVSFVYMLVLNLIYKSDNIESGFLMLNISGQLAMYLISFALFFAGASIAVFGFPRGRGRIPGPGRDSRDPRYESRRDSFGRY